MVKLSYVNLIPFLHFTYNLQGDVWIKKQRKHTCGKNYILTLLMI